MLQRIHDHGLCGGAAISVALSRQVFRSDLFQRAHRLRLIRSRALHEPISDSGDGPETGSTRLSRPLLLSRAGRRAVIPTEPKPIKNYGLR